MTSLLRTEIQALLQKLPPEKYAPVDTESFTLVLFDLPAKSHRRIEKALRRVCALSEGEVDELLSQELPINLKHGLSYSDAAIDQFELLACDALAFIIPDRVVQDPEPGYLDDLYENLASSADFELVEVAVTTLPAGPKALEYLDLFLGDVTADASITRRMMRRKALLMKIIADRIGGQVRICEPTEQPAAGSKRPYGVWPLHRSDRRRRR
jgi:hypothetical protein